MADNLRRGEIADIPFATWPGTWSRAVHLLKYWVLATNEPGADTEIDHRGAMGIVRLPFVEHDWLLITFVPIVGEDVEQARCELRLIDQILDGAEVTRLQAAVETIMRLQNVDAADALCYLGQITLMHRDWLQARRGQVSLLLQQPFVPTAASSVTDEELGALLPVMSVGAALDLMNVADGHLARGFPLPDDVRPSYNRIPMRVFPSDDGDPAQTSPTEPDDRFSVTLAAGGICTVTFDGESETFRWSRGMEYLVELLSNPNTEFDVLDLVRTGASDVDVRNFELATFHDETDQGVRQQVEQELRENLTGTKPVLDDIVDQTAKEQCEKELLRLKVEIKKAQDRDDEQSLAQFQRDEETINEYLVKIKAHRRRTRPFSDLREQARKSAGMAIKRARTVIGASLPALEAHLAKTLFTGNSCIYTPPAGVNWRISRHK